MHENGSLEVTPVFSTKASAIFIAAKDLSICLEVVKPRIPLRRSSAALRMTTGGRLEPAQALLPARPHPPHRCPISVWSSSLRSGAGKQAFQSLGHFSGLKAIRARVALVGDVAFAVQDVNAVRPCGVGGFGRVRQVVDERRDLERQLGQASFRQRAARLESLGAAHADLFFQVVLVLPSVHGMSFHNVNDKECSLRLVLVVEFVELGNLPAKRRSSVAAEDQHHRFVPAEGREADPRFPVSGGKTEFRRRVAHLQVAGAGKKPHLLERDDHEQWPRHLRHHLAEECRLPHDTEQRYQHQHVDQSDVPHYGFEYLHDRAPQKTAGSRQKAVGSPKIG
ncbi:hypothetical protein SBA2_50034 [Acidobacteriia bacterium SbA2]|nr:hypothetical protein SBA2_50034 [Acidobacteriia bacterium SbA2]